MQSTGVGIVSNSNFMCKTYNKSKKAKDSNKQFFKSSKLWQQSEILVYVSTKEKLYYELVNEAMETWNKILSDVYLKLVHTDIKTKANISVGFIKNDGNWSYIGNDSTYYARFSQSINLDPNLPNFNITIALHEFGHAIGLEHEHQHPSRYLKFDEDALANDPDLKDFDYKSQMTDVEYGTMDTLVGYYDPESIMHYFIKSEWIDVFESAYKMKLVNPEATSEEINSYIVSLLTENETISKKDAEFVKKIYSSRIGDESFVEVSIQGSESKAVEFSVENEQVRFESKYNAFSLYVKEITAKVPYLLRLDCKADRFTLPQGTYLMVLRSANNRPCTGKITYSQNLHE